MVVTVFRSRLRPEHAEEFQQLADRMLTLARGMPGFISYDTYLSEDGERASIVAFESAEHLRGWREHPEHAEAMRVGRERYYSRYDLLVADPLRESHFEHKP